MIEVQLSQKCKLGLSAEVWFKISIYVSKTKIKSNPPKKASMIFLISSRIIDGGPKLKEKKGEGYFAGQSHQIISYLTGVMSLQTISYLAAPYNPYILIDPSIVVFDKIPVIHTVRQLTKKSMLNDLSCISK